MENDSIALLDSLIEEARAKREQLDAQITLFEEQLKDLRKLRAQLRDEEVVLTSIVFRRLASSSADAPTHPASSAQPELIEAELPIGSSSSDDWSSLGRSEAVEAAVAELTAAKGFATPAEIEDLLVRHNRSDDSRDYIGASLAYLRKSGKAHTRARAEWIVGPEPVAPALLERSSLDDQANITAIDTTREGTSKNT